MKPMPRDQLTYQRECYDRHYPKMVAGIRDQMRHPLFQSFLDRLAGRILDLGAPAGAAQAAGGTLRLFEAGTGEGLLGTAIQRTARARGLDLAYTGADISAAAIDLARSTLQGELLVGDAVEVVAGLASASQDLVVAKNLLHHLDNPDEFLRQAARVAGPEGRIVVVEPRLFCPVHWINLMWFRQERYLYSGHRRNRTALRAAGLELLQEEEFSWLPFELAFATRFGLLRRLLSTSDPGVLRRVSEVDDRLTQALPRLALYVLWAVAGDGDASGGVTKSR